MPFIPLSYPQIVALTHKASERQPKAHFTQDEIELVNQNVEKNPFLKAVINTYAPRRFNILRAKYYEEHRAVHQEMGVHDPVFAGARSKTRTWLQELPSSQPVYDKANLAAYKTSLKQAFHTFVQQDGLKRRYPTEEAHQKAQEDFEQYFDKIFEVYQQGASHPETLMYYIQWCQAGDKQKMMLGKSEDQARFEDLFIVLDDARNAYKDYPTKFYPGHDWSCPPGMEERLLDMLTSIRKAEQPDMSTSEAYVVQGVSPFISAESNRSLGAGLYAVYESLAQKEPRTVYTLRLREDDAFQAQVDNDVRRMVASSKEAFENYQAQVLKIKEKAGPIDELVEQQIQAKERLSLTPFESKQLSGQQRMSLMQLKRQTELSVVTYVDDRLKAVEEIHDDLQQKNPDWNEEQRQEEVRRIAEAFESYQEGTAGVRTKIGVSELFLTAYPEISELRAKIAPYCLTNEKRVLRSDEELFEKMKEQLLQSLRLLAGEGLEDLPESSLFTSYQSFFEQESAEEVRAVQDEDGTPILLTADGIRILNDDDCLLAIANKTGLTQDHLELLMSIPTSGDGLAEFKASLEAGKKPERTLEEALRECSETKEKLMTLARQYLQDYPGEHGVYLSWDDAILDDLKSYIEQRPEDESLLLAQDRVLAEVVQRLAPHARGNLLRINIFKEAAQDGYLYTIRALLQQIGIDDLSKNIALKNAANRGHKEVVGLLLAQKRITDEAKNQALKDAATAGHKEIVELLLARERITVQTKQSVLVNAAIRGDKEIVELLLAQEGITDEDKSNTLENLARNGHKEIVELLLTQQGITDEAKNNSLILASYYGHKEIVELLLAQEGITDWAKNTALQDSGGHIEIVELLLRQPGITDDGKNEALKNAASRGYKEIVELLCAQPGITASAKNQALVDAARKHYKLTVQLLLKDPEITNEAKNSILKNAAWNGHKEMIETIIKSGVVLTIQDRALLRIINPYLTNEKTLEYLHEALERSDHQASKIFIEQLRLTEFNPAEERSQSLLFKIAGYAQPETLDFYMRGVGSRENINRADHLGETVLHAAIRQGNSAMVAHLLNHYPVNVKIKNSDRLSAMELAQRLEHQEIIGLLKEREGHTLLGAFIGTFTGKFTSLIFSSAKQEGSQPNQERKPNNSH